MRATRWPAIGIVAMAAATTGCADPYPSLRMSSGGNGMHSMKYDTATVADPTRKIMLRDCAKPFAPVDANLECR